jgi:hypothetical protein
VTTAEANGSPPPTPVRGYPGAWNIYIGNVGVSGESNVIRIGDATFHGNHFVNSMLLNEVQKQRRENDKQREMIGRLEERLARAEAALAGER